MKRRASPTYSYPPTLLQKKYENKDVHFKAFSAFLTRSRYPCSSQTCERTEAG
jgi:hypothetical protein